jgi:hypothetical protein
MFVNGEAASALAALGNEIGVAPTRMAQIIVHEVLGIEPPDIKPGRGNYKSQLMARASVAPRPVEAKPDEASDLEIRQMLNRGHSVAYICGTTKSKWRRVHDIKASL